MKYTNITYTDVKNNEEIKTYIEEADQTLAATGYTEHSFAHVTRCAVTAKSILLKLGYSEKEQEQGAIAGYMHDIGNLANRKDHAHSSAVMSFCILRDLGMDPKEISTIISAIGNHDEATANVVTAVSAALILADKSDVRRSRVRTTGRRFSQYDIHDRVNYAVKESSILLSDDNKSITLKIILDTDLCSVMDYFEIFLTRMNLCKRAANFLKLRFKLLINETEIVR